ncbi:RNA 3'-terminal phosphate cyclase isoform 3-T3 [Syngnathus typhle]
MFRPLPSLGCLLLPSSFVVASSQGGQILRVAAALSCISGSSVTIAKVRAGRSTPGLRPQHLSGLQLVSDMCGGVLRGGAIGSANVSLTPGKIRAGKYTADTRTAGSVCLLLQVALPCALYANATTTMCLRGGTNTEMAPQIDYILKVFKPIVEKFGVSFDCDIKMRGFFPKGGGEVTATVRPVKELQALTLLERGTITKIHGWAYVAGILPFRLAKDMAAAAMRTIQREIKELDVNIQVLQEEKEKACANGNGIIGQAEVCTIYAEAAQAFETAPFALQRQCECSAPQPTHNVSVRIPSRPRSEGIKRTSYLNIEVTNWAEI